MAANSYTQWQYLAPYGVGVEGGVPDQPGGGNPPATVWYRDSLDAMRSGRSDLTTGFPDGYLSTIRSRREDSPADQLDIRSNQRAYQRGVHKGERIDAQDYFWPDSLRLDAGINRQLKAAQEGQMAPRFSPLYPIVREMSPKGFAVEDVDSGLGSTASYIRSQAPPYR